MVETGANVRLGSPWSCPRESVIRTSVIGAGFKEPVIKTTPKIFVLASELASYGSNQGGTAEKLTFRPWLFMARGGRFYFCFGRYRYAQ